MEAAFHDRYSLHETVGRGAFSEVKVCVDKKDGIKYAVKIIDRAKCKAKIDMISTEIKVLKMINHENIVRLYDVYEAEQNIYLVMELVSGGELFDEIVTRGTFSEQDAAQMVQKILSAVAYLHSVGIVHRDLKPENLLLSKTENGLVIKISDFGLSKIYSNSSSMRTACGTPGYVAPEILRSCGYGPQVDLWSMGVITYILLCGYPPFFDPINAKLFKKIISGNFRFDQPWWDTVSDTAKDFICKLLVVDPGRRWNSRQALNHPFIASQCKTTSYCRKPVQNILSKITPLSIHDRFAKRKSGKLTIARKGAKTASIQISNLDALEQAKLSTDINEQKRKMIDRYQSVCTQSKNASKPEFSVNVNRISSWFRTVTLNNKLSSRDSPCK